MEGCCLLARCSLVPAAATAAACSVHSLSLLPLVPAANIAAACSVPLALLVAVAAAACRCSVRSCLPLLLAAKSLERDVRKRSQNKQLQHSRYSVYRVLLISGAGSSVAGSHCRTQVLA